MASDFPLLMKLISLVIFDFQNANYITFHNSEKVQSKSYSYWTEVLEIIKPYLNNLNIKVVQIGEQKDKKVDGVDYYITNTSFKQSFFLIKNAMLHLGIDSSPVHIASAFNKPTVSIYSHTYSNTCYPLWNENKRVIESDRAGKKPSFSLFEDPKTINLIKPEEIAQAVLDLLETNQTLTYKTINIGSKFLNKEINLIPSDFIPTVDVDNADDVDYAYYEDVNDDNADAVDHDGPHPNVFPAYVCDYATHMILGCQRQ
jgi:hypothetical protein